MFLIFFLSFLALYSLYNSFYNFWILKDELWNAIFEKQLVNVEYGWFDIVRMVINDFYFFSWPFVFEDSSSFINNLLWPQPEYSHVLGEILQLFAPRKSNLLLELGHIDNLANEWVFNFVDIVEFAVDWTGRICVLCDVIVLHLDLLSFMTELLVPHG